MATDLAVGRRPRPEGNPNPNPNPCPNPNPNPNPDPNPNPKPSPCPNPNPKPNPTPDQVTTSLLFGTAAFVTLVPLLVCTSVCVLRRRISRARGLGQPNPSAVEMGTAEARQGGLRAQASRRGLTQAQVDRLLAR